MIAGFIITGILILVLLLIAGCYLLISRHAATFIYDDTATIPFRGTALVLGTAKLTRGGNMNGYFRYRIEAAEKLFREKKCDMLIVSGADKGHHRFREADEMKNALIEKGIPAGAIMTDHAGYRTWDSLWRCQGSFGAHSITVVSQRFHIERAIYAGHKQGLNVIGYPAQSITGSTAARMFIRECLARVKCMLDCYILHPKPVYMRNMRSHHRPQK